MSKHLINAVSGTVAPPCDQLNCRHRAECAKGKACTLFQAYLSMPAAARIDYKVRMKHDPEGMLSRMIPSKSIYKKIFSED
jgi:hypothetical protein